MKNLLLALLLLMATTASASQADFDITTADADTGVTYRAAVNSALQALASTSSGATEPTVKYAYQLWADTTVGMLKQRNAANTAWINLMPMGTSLTATVAELNKLAGTPAGLTATEVGYLDGVTAAIQGQFSAKADYETGTFTGTLLYSSTTATGTITYTKMGNVVTLSIPAITGVSNNPNFGISGLPANLRMTTALTQVGFIPTWIGADNEIARVYIGTNDIISAARGLTYTAWPSSGTKGISPCSFQYIIK